MSIKKLNEIEIETHISKHIGIRSQEKNKYGEVFTSSELIHEMLNQLPKNSWNNPNNKWLDPATGNGNFMAIVYTKLLHGLKKKIPVLEKRKNHILQNMLYMVELNKSNINQLKQLFGKRANICQANFLDQSDKWTSDLGSSQFDIIVGNPPFQMSKKTKYKGSVGRKTLWDKFLDFIFKQNVLMSSGYLGFITPANWRRPEHELYKLLTRKNTLHYLHIYGKKDGMQKLNAQTRFDLFIVQEGSPSRNHKTIIIDEKGENHKMDLSKWVFLPNYAFTHIKKIIVPKEKGLKILFDSNKFNAKKLSKKKTAKNRHPIVHNITRRGLGLRYSKNKDIHFGTPKVLLNFNEKQYPFNDYEGKYGMSQITFGIPIKSKKEGEQIIDKINSSEFQEIIEATKWGSFQTDYRMFSYFDPNYFT